MGLFGFSCVAFVLVAAVVCMFGWCFIFSCIRRHKRSLPLMTYGHFFLDGISLKERAVPEKQGCCEISQKDLLSDCLSQFSVIFPISSV